MKSSFLKRDKRHSKRVGFKCQPQICRLNFQKELSIHVHMHIYSHVYEKSSPGICIYIHIFMKSSPPQHRISEMCIAVRTSFLFLELRFSRFGKELFKLYPTNYTWHQFYCRCTSNSVWCAHITSAVVGFMWAICDNLGPH